MSDEKPLQEVGYLTLTEIFALDPTLDPARSRPMEVQRSVFGCDCGGTLRYDSDGYRVCQNCGRGVLNG